MDVIFNQKFVAALKIWRGQKAREKGLVQLSDYLTVQSLTEGYLIVFDTMRVIKITEKFIELEFVSRNNGNIPAPIFGTTHTIEDHVAVHFFFPVRRASCAARFRRTVFI